MAHYQTSLGITVFVTSADTYVTATRDGVRFSTISNKNASTSGAFPRMLDQVLTSYSARFEDIAYLSASTLPGPLTSLRVVHTYLNGFAYAAHIPLIPINMMTRHAQILARRTSHVVYALHGAYGAYVTYARAETKHNDTATYGCLRWDALHRQIAQETYPVQVYGADASATQKATNVLADQEKVFVAETPYSPGMCAEEAARFAHEWWLKDGATCHHITPEYVKPAITQ